MSNSAPEDALTIYQRMFDQVSAAYETGNLGAFRDVVGLPNTIHTFEGTYRIENPHDSKSFFEAVCAHKQAQGVTDTLRICVTAKFKSRDEIEGTHVTHLTRNGTYLEDPFPSKCQLLRQGGVWKVYASECALGSKKSVGAVLRHGLRNTFVPNATDTLPGGDEDD